MSIGEVFLVGSETRGRGHDPGSPHTPRGGGENLGSPVCKSAGPRDSRSTTAATDPDDDDLANTGVTGSPSLVLECGGGSGSGGGTVAITQEVWQNLLGQHGAGNGDV